MRFTGLLLLAILFLFDIVGLFIEIVNYLHTKKLKFFPPPLALEIYGKRAFQRSCEYFIERIRVTILERLVRIGLFYSLFLTGSIQKMIKLVISSLSSDMLQTIVIFVIWEGIFFVLGLPFKVYNLFYIEKRYGFATITKKRFVLDLILKVIIEFLIFIVLVGGFIFLIKFTKPWWLYLTLYLILFSLFLAYIYPTWIAPLFNKFEPLANKELKDSIINLTKKANFPISNIFVKDASKRTTHTNAYFTGFGKKRRIVLFDTLLKKHTVSELIGILAHEIGHFKLKHIWKNLLLGSFVLFVISYIGYNLFYTVTLYSGLGLPYKIATGIFLLSILYPPVEFIISPLFSILSQRWEKEADKFAIKLTGDIDTYKSGLIKLHRDNLSHPYPHPFVVKLFYTHPPLLMRLAYLEKEGG